MKLIDSNIIIYSAKKEYAFLKELLREENIFISDITRLEVLGFHLITSEQEEYFNSIFSIVNVIPVSTEVIEAAIKTRRNYNLSVGDSIISATASVHELLLYTNNEDDFKNIPGLKIYNPIKQIG
jgi:predicted nucleic acid-binding protein